MTNAFTHFFPSCFEGNFLNNKVQIRTNFFLQFKIYVGHTKKKNDPESFTLSQYNLSGSHEELARGEKFLKFS